MKFIPTIEQVQEAAKQLPPVSSLDKSGPRLYYRTLVRTPFQWRAHDEATCEVHTIDFRLECYVDPMGREWFRWAYKGEALV